MTNTETATVPARAAMNLPLKTARYMKRSFRSNMGPRSIHAICAAKDRMDAAKKAPSISPPAPSLSFRKEPAQAVHGLPQADIVVDQTFMAHGNIPLIVPRHPAPVLGFAGFFRIKRIKVTYHLIPLS